MNSIKKKLFFQIGLLIVFLVSLMLLANTLLLESYYTYKQKNKLIDYYDTINSMNSNSYDDNLLEFISMEHSSNIEILITNTNEDILYGSKDYSSDNKDELQPPKGNAPPHSPVIKKTESIDDKIEFVWVENDILHNQDLMLSGTLDNDNIIELRIHLESIKTNIKLSNNFFLIIGLIAFIISMIFAYIVSIYFTKPITEMNDATNRMKDLNFDTSCEVISNDEIGQLAESINEMSMELSNTINSLNDKNIQLQKEIEEKNKLDQKRRTLLNNVSHELKTPLALMQGYAEGLKLNVVKNKKKSNFYCDVIIDESIKMNRLVESLLNIDQMEFGDKVLNKTPFEINEFILNILNKYKKIFQDKNIKWSINTINPIQVFGDNFMLERVFENYLTNAINYIDENLVLKIDLIKLKDHIRIEVFNSSPGIGENDLKRIWDAFYKLDKARTREKGGHGLGLSIIAAIQEAHNNAYGVKNINNGVCFWFEVDIDTIHK
ncbi:MAG: sensor histidine kinase [Clostridiaceae bacterium]